MIIARAIAAATPELCFAPVRSARDQHDSPAATFHCVWNRACIVTGHRGTAASSDNLRFSWYDHVVFRRQVTGEVQCP